MNKQNQLLETPLTTTPKQYITFNFNSVGTPITNKIFQLHILSESKSKNKENIESISMLFFTKCEYVSSYFYVYLNSHAISPI